MYYYDQDLKKGTQNNTLPKGQLPISTRYFDTYPYFHIHLQNECFPADFRLLQKGRPQVPVYKKTSELCLVSSPKESWTFLSFIYCRSTTINENKFVVKSIIILLPHNEVVSQTSCHEQTLSLKNEALHSDLFLNLPSLHFSPSFPI